jgi:hypothetical protein
VIKRIEMISMITKYKHFILFLYVVDLIFMLFIQPSLEHLHDGGLMFLFAFIILSQIFFVKRILNFNLIASVLISILCGLFALFMAFAATNRFVSFELLPLIRHLLLITIYLVLVILFFEVLRKSILT